MIANTVSIKARRLIRLALPAIVFVLHGCATGPSDASNHGELKPLIGKCYVAQTSIPIEQSKSPEKTVMLMSDGNSVNIGRIDKGERITLRKYDQHHAALKGTFYYPLLEVNLGGKLVLAQARNLFLGDYKKIPDPKRLRACDVVDGLAKPAQKYTSKEFEVALPYGVSAETRVSAKDRTAAVDFLATPPRGHVSVYSVERTDWSNAKRMTDAEFYAYWDGFLPDYLTMNFGKGHYALLKTYKTRHDAFPALGFIGTGMHGDEKSTGSIYGRAIYTGNQMVVLYGLTDTMIGRTTSPWIRESDIRALENLDGFDDFKAFVSSFKMMQTAEATSGD